jgi:hypothetical protein
MYNGKFRHNIFKHLLLNKIISIEVKGQYYESNY